MRAPTRAAATAAAVLILLGAVAWATVPILVILRELAGRTPDDDLLRTAALALGCLVGGMVAVRVLPTVPRALLIGAAALAGGVVLALEALPTLSAPAVTTGDLGALAAAVAATSVGTWLGARLPAGLGQLAAAAFVQLALITGLMVALALLHRALPRSDSVPVIGFLIALVAGGAVTVRIIPGATVGHIAGSWLALAGTMLVLTLLMASEHGALVIGAFATAFVLPFPIALAATGAALARPRAPAPDLPDAVVVRPDR